jgi:hypothetical protein
LPIGRGEHCGTFAIARRRLVKNETLATIRGQLEKAAFAEAWEQGRR